MASATNLGRAPALPTAYCGSCGGSGAFQGTYGDVECNDCGGEGQWDAEPEDDGGL